MTPSPEKKPSRGGLAALAVTLGSALIVVTCGTSREHTEPPATPPPPPAPIATATEGSAAPPISTEVVQAESAAPKPAAPAGPLPRSPGRELANFFAALRALEKHTREGHVRVEWLGDSHGAADLWSGPLRAALQKRFGDGGPGFVHVGYKAYRHDGIKHEVPGKWRMRPKGPSTMQRTGDGIFGLGGILFTPEDGPAKAFLTVTDPALPPSLQWDLCYKLAARSDEIEVRLTGMPEAKIRCSSNESVGELRHLLLTSSGKDPMLGVLPRHGYPEICGAIVETDPKAQPGVVLDTLGINGARLGTPLAWDEASWVAELRRRMPSLVILEYGTNESSDHTIDPAVYLGRLGRVMERVHKASPDCDCLVLAPTDRADTPEKTPLVRDALREAARAHHCMFWDTYAAMGGRGSIRAWHLENPPRAGADGVHLTARGYNHLGDKLAADVLAAYDASP